MVRRTVKSLVTERGKAYGPPSENHWRTARFWHAYDLNTKSSSRTPIDVCFLNILQKIARCQSEAGPSRDSLQDIKGYAENILMIMGHD
jgi:hypothetical protein